MDDNLPQLPNLDGDDLKSIIADKEVLIWQYRKYVNQLTKMIINYRSEIESMKKRNCHRSGPSRIRNKMRTIFITIIMMIFATLTTAADLKRWLAADRRREFMR